MNWKPREKLAGSLERSVLTESLAHQGLNSFFNIAFDDLLAAVIDLKINFSDIAMPYQ